jgi:hypothetical protein
MVDYHSIVRLIVKLFGVGLVVYGAVTLSVYLPSILLQTQRWDETTTALVLSYIMPLVTPFLVGALLWFFPATIANTVIRDTPSAKEIKADWSFELERVGVSLLGLYLLYRGVSDIIFQMVAHRARVAILGDVRAPDDYSALIAATIAELVIAILFVVQSRGIVNLLRKTRGQ